MQISFRDEKGEFEFFDLKKGDVPAKNAEIIGLNYDQFVKSILLSQGEFARFLRAKPEERGDLLEKITGTGIYRLKILHLHPNYSKSLIWNNV
jgi:exonuclease SbcC